MTYIESDDEQPDDDGLDLEALDHLMSRGMDYVNEFLDNNFSEKASSTPIADAKAEEADKAQSEIMNPIVEHASGVDDLMDYFRTCLTAAVGYREVAEQGGFSPSVSEQMAYEIHGVLIRKSLGLL